MPELSVLPVNVSKNIESKDELISFDSTISKGDFSKHIDLHLNKSNKAERNSHINNVKSEVKLSKNNSPSVDSEISPKRPNDLLESHNSKGKTNSVAVVQEVAASGNKDEIKPNEIDKKSVLESEKLISFLSKAESTLINQPVDTPVSISLREKLLIEERIIEQNADYETQLLLNGSNLVADLSSVAKALGDDQVDTLLSPVITEKTGSTEEQLLNNVVEEIDKEADKKGTHIPLSDELLTERQNKEAIETQAPVVLKNKTEMVEPETKINSENKVSTIIGDKTNTILAELKTEAQIKSENKGSTIIGDKSNTLLSELKTEAKMNSEDKVSIIIGDKTNTVLAEQTNSITDTKAAQQAGALIDRDLVSKSKEEVSSATNKKVIKNIDQVNIEMNNDKISQNLLLKEAAQRHETEALSGSQLTQSNNKNQVLSDVVKSLEKTIDTQGSKSEKSKTDNMSTLLDPQVTKNELTQSSDTLATTEKTNQAAFLNKNVSSSNQSITNDLIKDGVSKAQVKESEQALIEQNEDTVSVDTKVVVNDKKESPFNSNFIDVSGKATQVTQDIIDQQSTERVNPTSATEVTNSQKINAQLHHETISLFRKDFTEAVKDKVMLMISQKLQRFDITLDPPELGNMQVKVNLQGEQAVVNFIVQSQQTKDALEQNMHKLRESLAEQGVDVGDANVEQQSQQSANEEGDGTGNTNQSKSDIDNISEANDVITHTLSSQVIDSATATVDYYA